MYFISTNSKDFPWEQAEELYNTNKKYFLPLDIAFKELVKSLKNNVWATITDNQFIGLIYFELKNNKWFISGASTRKMSKHITKAINGICELYFEQTDTIYSETPHKWAKQALRRAGFAQIENDLFMKGRK